LSHEVTAGNRNWSSGMSQAVIFENKNRRKLM